MNGPIEMATEYGKEEKCERRKADYGKEEIGKRQKEETGRKAKGGRRKAEGSEKREDATTRRAEGRSGAEARPP